MRGLFLVLVILGASSVSRGDNPSPGATQAFTLGHNFTPTTDTLPAGGFTVGTYALAYGLTDWLSIGTSPWIVTCYNMPMVSLRSGFDLVPGVWRMGIDFNYFRTVPILLNWYDQESTYLRLTVTRVFSESYRLHVGVSHQAFLSGEIFYSLRLYSFQDMPGEERHDYNLTASTLHQITWSPHWGTFLELGLSGMNYSTKFLLLGASVYWKSDSFLVQFGASYTHPTYRDDNVTWWGYARAVIHPEIQLQYFL